MVFCPRMARKFENVSLHGRGWDYWRLVLRYTFSSSSRQLCHSGLGVFSNLENFFTYRVAPKSCVRSHVSGHNTVESRSWLQAHCADVMGSIARQWMIIMSRSVKVMIQAWRVFQNWWGGGQSQWQAYNGWDMSSETCIQWRSCQRISVIVM